MLLKRVEKGEGRKVSGEGIWAGIHYNGCSGCASLGYWGLLQTCAGSVFFAPSLCALLFDPRCPQDKQVGAAYGQKYIGGCGGS